MWVQVQKIFQLRGRITMVSLIWMLVTVATACSLFGRSEEVPKEIVVASTSTPSGTPTATLEQVATQPELTATATLGPTNTVTPIPTATPVNGIAGDRWFVLTRNLNLPAGVEPKHLAIATDGSGELALGWYQPNRGLQVVTSSDNGNSWSPASIVVGIANEKNLPLLGSYWLTYGNDNLYASWVETTPSSKVLSAMSPDNGRTWLEPTTIDDGMRQPQYRYDARAVSLMNNRLAAVWAEGSSTFEVYFSISQENNLDWSDDQGLAEFEHAIFLGDLMHSGDTLYLGLVEKSDTGDHLYLLVSNDLGQSWLPPRKISGESENIEFGLPQLTLLAQDKVALLVSAKLTRDDRVELMITMLEPDGPEQPQLRSILDDNGKLATELGRVDLVNSNNELLYAIWSDNRDGTLRTYLSFSPDGKDWSPNLQVQQNNDGRQTDLSLVIGTDDTLFVTGMMQDENEDQSTEIFLLKSEPDPEALALSGRPTATPFPTPTPFKVAAAGVYQLAYTKWDGRFHDLYIGDTNGANETLIFSRAAGPSFSPDGKRLYFFGEQGVNQQYRTENRVICEFGTISDGIVALDLMSPLRDICEVQYDAWFCERKHVDVAAEPSDVCTANGISIYQNLDWKEGTARWTSVSPDSQAVAFDAKPGGTYRIYFRNVVGTSQQARIEILGEQGSWSPDSQQMVYRSGRDNQQGLWIANRDDTGHRLLTNTGTDSFPTWSPNGRTIAFSREIDGNVDIYTIGVDGSNVQRLTDAPGPDSLPVYTPDGQIIFRSARSGSWGIWKMNGNGSNQQEIIPNADVSPDWAFNRMDVR